MLDTGMSRMSLNLDDEPETLQRAIELFQIKGFAQINIAARFKRGLFHTVDVVSCDRDDWNVFVLAFEFAEVFNRLETVKNRHIEIHYDQAGTIAPRYIKRLLAVFGLKNAIAFYFKGPLEHNARVLRIFRDQDGRIEYRRGRRRS